MDADKIKLTSNEPIVTVEDGAGGFLSFLLQSLVDMANDASNDKFFLPKFLATLKVDGGKTLVPYQTDIKPGPQPSLKDQVGTTVCNNGWATLNGYSKSEAEDNPTLNISSATINGLNNAKVTQFATYPANDQTQYGVVFGATLNAYADYDKLTFNPAAFFFDVTCQTVNLEHKDDLQATGTFQASIGAATFNVALLISFNDDLTVSIDIPENYTPPGKDAMPGVNLVFGTGDQGLKVTNITLDGDSPYKSTIESFIQEAFGQQSTTKKIEDLFNSQINGASVRQPIAEAVETQFQNIINDLK